MNHQLKFVNRMLNLSFTTGAIVRSEDPQVFCLRKGEGGKHDIPFRVSEGFVLPPDGAMRTVMAHIRGVVGEYGPTAVADAISIDMPSIGNANPFSMLLLGHARRLYKKDLPNTFFYDARGNIKGEVLQELKRLAEQDAMLHALVSIYEQELGHTRVRYSANSNVVRIAGILHRASFIPPNAHQSAGFGLLMLRQHKSLDNLIPIRVTSNQIEKVLKNLRVGMPIALRGRLMRAITMDPEQTMVISDVMHIETDAISTADERMILPPPPDWYKEYMHATESESGEGGQKDKS